MLRETKVSPWKNTFGNAATLQRHTKRGPKAAMIGFGVKVVPGYSASPNRAAISTRNFDGLTIWNIMISNETVAQQSGENSKLEARAHEYIQTLQKTKEQSSQC